MVLLKLKELVVVVVLLTLKVEGVVVVLLTLKVEEVVRVDQKMVELGLVVVQIQEKLVAVQL